MDFRSFGESPEPEKPRNSLYYPSKTRSGKKSVRNCIRRSPGSIFHEFDVVLGGLAVILDLRGASVLEVGF